MIGVQAEGAAAYPASLAAGHPVRLESMSTMADGIAVGTPGTLTFAMVAGLVDQILTVDEELISRALLLCWNGRSWWSSRPAWWLRLLCWTRRPRAARAAGAWPSCPAATSTRCCCCG